MQNNNFHHQHPPAYPSAPPLAIIVDPASAGMYANHPPPPEPPPSYIHPAHQLGTVGPPQTYYVQPHWDGTYRVSTEKEKMHPVCICFQVMAGIVAFCIIMGVFIVIFSKFMEHEHEQ